jgi:carboxyl-terminal processing protease
VTITIQRQGWKEPRPFSLTRDIIPLHSVKASFLAPGFAYLRITNFQSHTTRDFKQKLADLQKDQAIRGLILDLRNNPGGLLNQAISISDIFLKQGMIVSTRGRTEDQNMVFQAHDTADDSGIPMVVLVNEGSASASEIVAGAIQDHKRGIIVGTRTFGKGSVQTIIPLPDGAGLRMTTAKYYTPADRSIQALGISPDVEVSAQEAVNAGDRQSSSEILRETDLQNHFQEKKEGTPSPAEPIDKEIRERLKNDIQLNTALNILKSLDLFSDYRKEQTSRK